MAFTLNGIGTTFYGQRDFRMDGTYITTEWFAVLYVPVIPLRSLRVRHQGPGEHYLGFGSSDSYAVYEKLLPNWKQVVYTYGYVAFMVAWVVFLGSCFPRAFNSVRDLSFLFVAWMIPVPTPWYAYKKIRASP